MTKASLAVFVHLLPCFILGLGGGCESLPHGGQTFTVVVGNELTPAKMVVLEEVYCISGAPDAPSPYKHENVLGRCFVVDGNQFIAKAPHLIDRACFSYSRRYEYRWTIFSPSAVITTVYPEGCMFDWSNPSGTGRNQPSVGWLFSPSKPMDTTYWYSLNQEFPLIQNNVQLKIPLRTLKSGHPTTNPIPPDIETLPEVLTYGDVYNFADQLNAMIRLLEKHEEPNRDPELKRIIWEAVSKEYETSLKAGYSETLDKVQLDQKRDRLQRLLGPEY